MRHTRTRMDKYLYLIRQMLLASLRYVAQAGFSTQLSQELSNIMAHSPLNPTDSRIPNGLRYHVLDVIVDGLEHVREDATQLRNPDAFLNFIVEFLEPLRRLRQESPVKTMRKRAAEVLADDRLEAFGAESSREGMHDGFAEQKPNAETIITELDEADEWGGFED